MTNYYFEVGNDVAPGYIRQCIIDAFRSEGLEPVKHDLEVFNETDHSFAEQGFVEVTIGEVPVDKIRTKINYRLHRNGKNYGIYKKHVRKDGVEKLYVVKDIRAVIGNKVEQEVVAEEQELIQINADNVRNIFLCAHPEGKLFLSKDNKYVINTSPEKEENFEVYENKKKLRRSHE